VQLSDNEELELLLRPRYVAADLASYRQENERELTALANTLAPSPTSDCTAGPSVVYLSQKESFPENVPSSLYLPSPAWLRLRRRLAAVRARARSPVVRSLAPAVSPASADGYERRRNPATARSLSPWPESMPPPSSPRWLASSPYLTKFLRSHSLA